MQIPSALPLPSPLSPLPLLLYSLLLLHSLSPESPTIPSSSQFSSSSSSSLFSSSPFSASPLFFFLLLSLLPLLFPLSLLLLLFLSSFSAFSSYFSSHFSSSSQSPFPPLPLLLFLLFLVLLLPSNFPSLSLLRIGRWIRLATVNFRNCSADRQQRWHTQRPFYSRQIIISVCSSVFGATVNLEPWRRILRCDAQSEISERSSDSG